MTTILDGGAELFASWGEAYHMGSLQFSKCRVPTSAQQKSHHLNSIAFPTTELRCGDMRLG